MKVKFFDGPMAGRMLSIRDNTTRIFFPSFPEGQPILSPEAEKRLVNNGYNLGPFMGEVRQIEYTIRQVNGE